MQDIQLFAVGRDSAEIDEIVNITKLFLGDSIPIKKITLDSLFLTNRAFYIAPKSEAKLISIIPKDKLFLFDLHPTKKFFNSLKKIPKSEIIYVFNSHFSYINLLMSECRVRGVYHNFFPIAFMEQPLEDVKYLLSRAEYIVGVDYKLGTQALFSEKYRGFLRDNVTIISGRRAASAKSGGRLLAGIAGYYEEAIKDEFTNIKWAHKLGVDVEIYSNALFNRIFKVALFLANAKYLIRASEGNNSYDDELFLDDDELELTGEPISDFRKIESRILDFSLLRQRLQMLTIY